MNTILKILIVGNTETDADLIVSYLKKENINFSHSRVWNKDVFINALKENNHDLKITNQIP